MPAANLSAPSKCGTKPAVPRELGKPGNPMGMGTEGKGRCGMPPPEAHRQSAYERRASHAKERPLRD